MLPSERPRPVILRLRTRVLHKHLKALNGDQDLLLGLVYRGRNQFRGSPWWRKIIAVKRSLAAVCTLAMKLAEAFERLESTIRDGGQVDIHIVRQSATDAFGLKKSIEKLQLDNLKAYSALRQIIELEAFLPLVLTLTAIVARLNTICVALDEMLGPVSTSLSSFATCYSASASSLTEPEVASTLIDSSSAARQSEDAGISELPPKEAIITPIQKSVPVSQGGEADIQAHTHPASLEQPIKRKKRRKNEIEEIFGSL